MFASLLVVNAQSWFYYTDRLVEFRWECSASPWHGDPAASVAQARRYRCSRLFARAGLGPATDNPGRVPAALGLALLAEPLSSTLFYRGAFTLHDTRMVAISVTAMSVGVLPFMLTKVLLPAFYAGPGHADADARGDPDRCSSISA
jgi:putative peptidoglycan lipid II flippase